VIAHFRIHMHRCLLALAVLITGHSILCAQVARPPAQARDDQGPVEPSFWLSHMRIMFRQTPEQQAALASLLAAQRNPASPDYHRWLTPEQYADRFGMSPADLARVTSWLISAGFTIESTARGRDWIAFSGTAEQVDTAFHASVHRYLVGGESHFAAATAPVIPPDLQPSVATVLGLNDFHPRPMLKPGYTTPSGHSLAPGDLALIYDINGLYNAGFSGTGQTIAIVGQAVGDLSLLSDVEEFRTNFGLGPAGVQLFTDGTPAPNGPLDLQEADLDLEWAGAIAPNATLVYVYGDADGAALFAIDQDLAPIISESFGSCETETLPSASSTFETQAQKANAMGITWIAASGDSGAADCDLTSEPAALQGPAVNFPASIPEVTAVGGTEFNEGDGLYWSPFNGATGGSALGYIPETAWNDTVFGTNLSTTLAATGGGGSTFYSKPLWQTGLGVPADSVRNVPDIALAASGKHDPYTVVISGELMTIGGTSAATPVFAGILALLNQYLGENGAGNINPNLYGLAAAPSLFHDIVTGSNIVPCVFGAAPQANCPAAGYGYGYYAGPGYDLATGLGSVDACNLVTGWRGTSASITSLSPAMIADGNAAFTLTVNGSGFTGCAVVQWNGTALPTAFVSATQLTATVSATLIASPETAAVSVAGGGKVSGSMSFRVTAPAISVSDQRVTTQAPPASGCVVPPSATTFQTTNKFIYLYFNAVVSNTDELTNNWLAPDGTVISGTQWGQQAGNFCFDNAPALAISNLPTARLGTWVARVYDNGTLLFSIAFTVSAPASSVTVTSIGNAASGAGGPIAPGEMVAIKGSGLGPASGISFTVDPVTGKVDPTLAGTQVFFGSFAAPITYTSAGQINAIVPYEIAGQSQVTMQVQYQGSSWLTVLYVATAAPGAFTFNGTGTGQAIAANQDGSLNGSSNPAAPGSYVTVYFTGGGETHPPGVDGSVTGSVLKWLTQPVSVTVGGVAATVAFDGAAPTFVDGVGQLNIQLANNTPAGAAQPVVITVGGIDSAATATLSVH